MKLRNIFILFVFAITALFSLTTFTTEAEARAGSGRTSSGSRGSRSYTKPAAQPAPQAQRPTTPPPVQAPPQASSGGFFRSMAGGIVGGMLGGMLFRSLGFAGPGGAGGGGGIGIFEIILIGGIIYLIYRYIKKRREAAAGDQNNMNSFEPVASQPYQQQAVAYDTPQDDVATGISHIRQMDINFDEQRFNDNVLDSFFKIQSAWMNRDLSTASALLTAPMRQTFQSDIDQLIREKRTNRLENIAVRNVEIVEAWQESGQDFITTLVYANLLDYTTDDATGQVVSGSKTDPVKFEEFWTFTRPVGNNPWQLSAIEQK
jgi:predicted lipid-binding transport protein (Tim44 family)